MPPLPTISVMTRHGLVAIRYDSPGLAIDAITDLVNRGVLTRLQGAVMSIQLGRQVAREMTKKMKQETR